MEGRYLLISDLQIPFEHPKALEFCKYLTRHFKINTTGPDSGVICLGDEVDEYWGSLFEHDPDADHTPVSEIKESIDKIKQWVDAFPVMKICISNHGERWKKKAFKSGIPSILMRQYQEVLETPSTWAWAPQWKIPSKRPFNVEHGDRFGGQTPHLQACLANGVSTAIGHHHAIAGIEHINTCGPHYLGMDIWGMCGASLIDFKRYAFHYGHKAKRFPKIGTPVILDEGALPIWCPLE